MSHLISDKYSLLFVQVHFIRHASFLLNVIVITCFKTNQSIDRVYPTAPFMKYLISCFFKDPSAPGNIAIDLRKMSDLVNVLFHLREEQTKAWALILFQLYQFAGDEGIQKLAEVLSSRVRFQYNRPKTSTNRQLIHEMLRLGFERRSMAEICESFANSTAPMIDSLMRSDSISRLLSVTGVSLDRLLLLRPGT